MSKQPEEFRLDAGFWKATGLLGVISILLMIGVVTFPINSVLREASSASLPIDFLFRFMAFFSVPIIVFVNGYIIYFAIRYRRRKDEPMGSVGSSIHDHRVLENTWTIIPCVLMVVLGVLSYLAMPQYYLRGKDSAATIEAIGHTFYFEFRYPGLNHSVDEDLYLPVGVPVTIDLTSAEADERLAVIHSFWVPEFRVKQDMIPGMIVPIHFTPTQIGKYHLICTEFCGVGHSEMRGHVIVVSRAAFDAWYAGQQKNGSAAGGAQTINLAAGNASNGQALFNQKCSACHNAAPFDQRKVGPGLANLFHDPAHPNLVDGKPANAKDVAWILQHGFQGPLGAMPNQQANGLSPKDIADLIAYLQTLK